MLIDVRGVVVCFSSVDLSVDFRTAPTRSFASRDHDSIRLWANQQAAGPNPLIVNVSSEQRLRCRKLFSQFLNSLYVD